MQRKRQMANRKVTIAIIIILILSGNAKYGLNYIMMSSANGDMAL